MVESTLKVASGDFKLLQLADLHWTNIDAPYTQDDHQSDLSPVQRRADLTGGQATFHFIERILDQEHPDLVVFSGDNTATVDIEPAMNDIYSLCEKRKIHFTVILGNHDDGHGLQMTRREIIERSLANRYPHSLTQVGTTSGAGNYRIRLCDTEGEERALLSFLDSGGDHAEYTYDYIKSDQINWFKEAAKQHNTPHLVFMHIAPQEAIDHQKVPHDIVGVCQELPSPSLKDSGIYKAMKEKQCLAVFLGHDHINDHSIRKLTFKEDEPKEVWMVAGGCPSYLAYGKVGLARRIRMIVVKENKEVHTYKRLDDERLTVIDYQKL